MPHYLHLYTALHTLVSFFFLKEWDLIRDQTSYLSFLKYCFFLGRAVVLPHDVLACASDIQCLSFCNRNSFHMSWFISRNPYPCFVIFEQSIHPCGAPLLALVLAEVPLIFYLQASYPFSKRHSMLNTRTQPWCQKPLVSTRRGICQWPPLLPVFNKNMICLPK